MKNQVLDTNIFPKASRLTTRDNPWNPFTNFNEWNLFDNALGYNTINYLARVSDNLGYNENLTEIEKNEIIELAIFEILSVDPTGMYIRVQED